MYECDWVYTYLNTNGIFIFFFFVHKFQRSSIITATKPMIIHTNCVTQMALFSLVLLLNENAREGQILLRYGVLENISILIILHEIQKYFYVDLNNNDTSVSYPNITYHFNFLKKYGTKLTTWHFRTTSRRQDWQKRFQTFPCMFFLFSVELLLLLFALIGFGKMQKKYFITHRKCDSKNVFACMFFR